MEAGPRTRPLTRHGSPSRSRTPSFTRRGQLLQHAAQRIVMIMPERLDHAALPLLEIDRPLQDRIEIEPAVDGGVDRFKLPNQAHELIVRLCRRFEVAGKVLK